MTCARWPRRWPRSTGRHRRAATADRGARGAAQPGPLRRQRGDARRAHRHRYEGLERTAGLVGDLRDFAAPGSRERGPVDLARGLRTTLRLMGHTLVSAGIQVHADLPEGCADPRRRARAEPGFSQPAQERRRIIRGWGRCGLGGGPRGGQRRARGGPRRRSGRGARAARAPVRAVRHHEVGPRVGLGLSISRRIVEDHGGRLELESVRGAGTRVVMRFPLPDSLGAGREGRDAA